MLRREMGLFAVNGIIAVVLAYAVYWVLVVKAGFAISVANGTAYAAGMAFGFFANKKMAFRDKGRISTKQVTRYIVLHLFTLIVNVSVNSAMLELIRGVYGDMLIAFMAAISISTVLNFLGLKYLVFNRPGDASPRIIDTRTLLP